MRFSVLALSATVFAILGSMGMDSHGDVVTPIAKGGRIPASPEAAFRQIALADGKTGRLVTVAQLADAEAPMPEIAQQAQPAPAARPPAASGPAATVVDESALRYFASRGETERLQQEIARLKALYPDWNPPADPLAVPGHADPEIDAMWRLYSENRFADVRAAIAARQAREPGWQPQQDLIERLEIAETRQRLIDASNAGDDRTVIDLAAATPSLRICEEIDVLWRLGEAFARTGAQARAKDVYTYILTRCGTPEERFATLQKAAELLPPETVEELLALERTGEDGRPEFETLRDELARRFVGEASADAAVTVPQAWLTRLETLARDSGLASDAEMLGWYYYRRNALQSAETWFRRAMEREPSATAAQGLGLILIARNEPGEAEALMYRWRTESDETRDVYLAAADNLLALDPPREIEGAVLQRMASAVAAARNAPAARQFGWYARNFGQPQTAAQWFRTALSWEPDEESASYGLALSLYDLGDSAGVAAIQQQWSGRSERIAAIGRTAAPAAPAARTATASRPRSAAAPASTAGTVRDRGCRTPLDPSGLSGAQALSRGWCLMELNRPMEAATAFERALQAGSEPVRQEAAYGQGLAYMRLGLTAKAAVAAAKAPLDDRRAAELQAAILAERALTAFSAGRYTETLIALDQRNQIAPDRQDLMVIRGYAYMNLSRLADARKVFMALAEIGNRDGQRGLADVRQMMSGGG